MRVLLPLLRSRGVITPRRRLCRCCRRRRCLLASRHRWMATANAVYLSHMQRRRCVGRGSLEVLVASGLAAAARGEAAEGNRWLLLLIMMRM